MVSPPQGIREKVNKNHFLKRHVKWCKCLMYYVIIVDLTHGILLLVVTRGVEYGGDSFRHEKMQKKSTKFVNWWPNSLGNTDIHLIYPSSTLQTKPTPMVVTMATIHTKYTSHP